MVNYSEVELGKIVVHQVGNKLQDEGFKFSKGLLKLEDSIIRDLLLKYFLSPFKESEYYTFSHETDLNLNEIFNYVSKIFADPDSFYLQSLNISKHLYENSTHPKIKGGEFYIVYFKYCLVDNDQVDAIGLFKSESKERFLKVYSKEDNFEVDQEEGVNINKLDKGCLIFNVEQEKGFKVCTVDNVNKSNEAQYWKEDFLKIMPREDNFYHTQNYMKLCQDFVSEKLKENFEVSKADEIDLMNRSNKYFKEKEVFDFNEFSNDIIQQPEIIDAFKSYKSQFQEENSITIFDEFDIAQNAVKKQAKVYKSILKLDKNFHVYIHGNREYIVKGYDEETKMNYYQLYFKEES
jgi:hypothetical protein